MIIYYLINYKFHRFPPNMKQSIEIKRDTFRVEIRKNYNKQLFKEKRKQLQLQQQNNPPNKQFTQQILISEINQLKKYKFNAAAHLKIISNLQLLERDRFADDQILKYFRFLVQKAQQHDTQEQYIQLLRKLNCIMFKFLEQIDKYSNYMQLVWPILKHKEMFVCWTKVALTQDIDIKRIGFRLFMEQCCKLKQLQIPELQIVIEVLFFMIAQIPTLPFSSAVSALPLFKMMLKQFNLGDQEFRKVVLCLIQMEKQDYQIECIAKTEMLIGLIVQRYQQIESMDACVVYLRFIANLFKGDDNLSKYILTQNQKIVTTLNKSLQKQQVQIIYWACFALANFAANGPLFISYFSKGNLMKNIIKNYSKCSQQIKSQIILIFFAIMTKGQHLQKVYLYEINFLEIIGSLIENDETSAQILYKSLRIIYELLISVTKIDGKQLTYSRFITKQLIFKFNFSKRLQDLLTHKNGKISQLSLVILQNFFNPKLLDDLNLTE